MVKDLFARHTPFRPNGYEVRRKEGDVSFLLKYERSECASLLIMLDLGEFRYKLGVLRLSFCLACGRFLGFGTRYDLCWICESELEQLEDEIEP
jgi:hypothetical protein